MSPLVYQAINGVAAELAEIGIAKSHRNDEGDYLYRSIEDVLSALAPLLARYKLCVLPRVLDREAVQNRDGSTQLVAVRAAFDLVSALDGSTHTIECFGEAWDDSDKGTAKAISAAYKSAVLQAFCVPVKQEGVDATSPRLNGRRLNDAAAPEPPEGWDNWVSEVIDIAKSCESAEAIDRLRGARRRMLSSLQHSRPDLYASIGETIASKFAEFQMGENRLIDPEAKSPRKPRRRKLSSDSNNALPEPTQAA